VQRCVLNYKRPIFGFKKSRECTKTSFREGNFRFLKKTKFSESDAFFDSKGQLFGFERGTILRKTSFHEATLGFRKGAALYSELQKR
jgi:hypothetical protein